MRAYPFGLLLRHDVARAEQWAVEHSRMTHQAPIALAACAAMAVGVAGEVRGDAPGEVLTEMVGAAGRYDAGTARMAEEALADAANGADPVAVLERLQGWAAHEAIAAAMFVVARHERDLPGALLEGANAAGDSDSIATLATARHRSVASGVAAGRGAFQRASNARGRSVRCDRGPVGRARPGIGGG